MKDGFVEEEDLASLAKKFRQAAGKSRAEAARDMGVKHPSVFHAEESPEKGYLKLRKRMIETYSPFKVSGPFYFRTYALCNKYAVVAARQMSAFYSYHEICSLMRVVSNLTKATKEAKMWVSCEAAFVA